MASTAEVTNLYQTLLGRAPDAGGLAHYSRYGNIGAVRSSIIGSAEYKARSTPAPAPAGKSSQQLYEEGVASQNQILQNKLNAQKAEQEGLFGNYENIRKNQEALPALYNRLQTEAGIPGLSQTAQGFKDEIYKVKDRLDRLGEDVTARTTGTLTTDAQRRRLQTAEAEPLQTNLGRLGTGLAPVADMLSSANQSVATQMGLQTEQQDRELEPVKLRINAISDRFGREISGYSMERESVLDNLLDKLKRERALSDRDWELAQTLAAEERNFSRQKTLVSTQLNSNNLNQPSTPVAPPKPSISASAYLSAGKAPSISGVGVAQPGRISSVGVARPQGISGVSVARPTSRLVVR